MDWTQLLVDYCDAIREHDTMKLAVFFVGIIQQQGTHSEFDTKLSFNIVNSEIKQALEGHSTARGDGDTDDDYFQQLFIASIDLCTAVRSTKSTPESIVKAEIAIVNLLSKKLLTDPSFFLSPVIIVVKDLRRNVFTFFTEDGEMIDNFSNCIQRPFKVLISNKSENTINISAIHIFASHLFSIYLKYNKINALINLYKVLSGTILNDNFNKRANIDTSPALPTEALFKYFIGLSLLIQSNYLKAYTSFKEALSHKHSKTLGTKIRFYILPLRYLIDGELPRDALFEKYKDLKVLKPLFIAMKQLSLESYSSTLARFKPLLLHFKVYAIYLKLIPKIQLQILKSTYDIYKSITKSEKPHIVGISVFATGLCLPPLHAECILCQLIANKNINGYLSHSQQAVVLSKTNPFPV